MNEAWQAYMAAMMGPQKNGYIYPLEGVMYRAFCAGWRAAEDTDARLSRETEKIMEIVK